MKALSLRQPWAYWIFHGKPVENRNWWIKYRGELLIHSSRVWDQFGQVWILRNADKLGVTDIPDHQDPRIVYGALIGKVRLTSCVRKHPSPWFFGPVAAVFRDPQEFKVPVPFSGQLGIFDVPDSFILGKIGPYSDRFEYLRE